MAITATAVTGSVELPRPVARPDVPGSDRMGFVLFIAVASIVLVGSVVFGPVLVPSADHVDKPFLKMPATAEVSPGG